MRMKCLPFLICAFCMPLFLCSQSSDEYIYGVVQAKSGETYKGFMRWGKEEMAWHDVFNSVKLNDKETAYYHEKDGKDKGFWEDFNWNISSIWEDKYRQTAHTFACFFGDIKALYPQSGSKLTLELKNGTKLKLDGGSNDIGNPIQVYDSSAGLVNIDWGRIRKIEFSQAPYMAILPFGSLLYGNISTYRKGDFKGYIKWDLDERSSKDVLDGYGEGGEHHIPFGDIAKIKKYESGVVVYDKSGGQLYLKGTNDVNASNRGIAVYVDQVGRVEIPWYEFKYASFEKNREKGPSYNDFEKPKAIKVWLRTYTDEEYKGFAIFDIDEKWELEFLDGDDDSVKYQIPFRNIATIYPKNKAYSIVVLNNGKELLLGERQDVSGKNDGILIFKNEKDNPVLVKWADITEMKLLH